MENFFEGVIIVLIGLGMSFLAVVAMISAVLVFSTIPKRNHDR